MSFKQELAAQVAQRRTFAIISHPDAGKTTMTEKLLLWGQAIQVAGKAVNKPPQSLQYSRLAKSVLEWFLCSGRTKRR